MKVLEIASDASAMAPPHRRADVFGSEAVTDTDTVSVRVVLFGELKRLARHQEIDLQLPTGADIHAVARELGRICDPAFAARCLTSEGALQPHVAVFLDGAQLRSQGDSPAQVSDGQVELMLLPMYEGG